MSDAVGAHALLPCPFCGRSARYNRDHTTEQIHSVSCSPCGLYISDDDQPDSCIAAWNRRAALPPSPPASDELDRLRAENERLRSALTEIRDHAGGGIRASRLAREALAKESSDV